MTTPPTLTITAPTVVTAIASLTPAGLIVVRAIGAVTAASFALTPADITVIAAGPVQVRAASATVTARPNTQFAAIREWPDVRFDTA